MLHDFDPGRILDTLEAGGWDVTSRYDETTGEWGLTVTPRTTNPDKPNPIARVRRRQNYARQWAFMQLKAGGQPAVVAVVDEIGRRGRIAFPGISYLSEKALRGHAIRIRVALWLASLSLAIMPNPGRE